MSEILYEYETKVGWYLSILFGIFLMIAGIDLVILLITSYNTSFLIIVSGIYGVGAIIILIGLLGIYIVERYGIIGDFILKCSIVAFLVAIPIIFLLTLPNSIIFAIIPIIMLILFIVASYRDIRRTQMRHHPNPQDDLRIYEILVNISLVILGIILIPLGIYVNDLIMNFLPWIYSIGSYGFAFIITGVGLVFSRLLMYYRKQKEKIDREERIQEKKGDLQWLKHQYYDLGRSIQDIADELDESMITIKKWLENIDKPAKKPEKLIKE